MCTVSVIPGASGRGSVRIVCNRDESRLRAPAAAPRWRSFGAGLAIWPMDLEAGGTWIAATEAGLALCLLNLNSTSAEPAPTRARSRGLLIPDLLPMGTAARAVDVLSSMALSRYAPFRLIALDLESREIAEARWDGRSLGRVWHAEAPVCFVSSGLSDALVSPRLELFESAVIAAGSTEENQDRFHRHAWADRPEISVLMSRADARTVSITTLELASGPAGPTVRMVYESVAEPGRTPAALSGLRS